MSDQSRVEQLLRNALGEDIYEVTPQSRVEVLLAQLNELIEGMGGGSVSPEENQNAFSNIKIDSTVVSADSKTDTLELTAGNNITLTPDIDNDKITIAATDTTYSEATTTTSGLMSATDKSHLDAVYDDYITALAALLGDTAETIWEGSVTFELYEGEFGDYYTGYVEWEAGSSPSMAFSANEQWRVTIDGTAYTASTSYYEYGETYYLGNTKYDDPMGQVDDGSGIPFTIIGSEGYWQGGFDPSIFTLGTHTIKFERLNT